jgi:hypothetical protein
MQSGAGASAWRFRLALPPANQFFSSLTRSNKSRDRSRYFLAAGAPLTFAFNAAHFAMSVV